MLRKATVVVWLWTGVACASPKARPRSSNPIAAHSASASAVVAAPTVSSVVDVAPKDAIGTVLERDIGAGKDVAIVIDGKLDNGLWAVRADRSKKKLLDAGPVAWVASDPRSHVIWLAKSIDNHSEQLCFVDLDGFEIETQVVGLAPTAMSEVYFTDVRFPERRLRPPHLGAIDETLRTEGWEVVLALDASEPHFELVWGSGGATTTGASYRPQVAFDGSIREPMRSRLREIARRGAQRPLAPWPALSKMGKVLADIEDSCEWNPKTKIVPNQTLWPDVWCRDAETVAHHDLWRVVVGSVMGAGTFATWRFYDPKRRRVLDVFDQPFFDAMISPSGKAAIARGVLAEFSETEVVSSQDYDGDWLGGGVYWPKRQASEALVH